MALPPATRERDPGPLWGRNGFSKGQSFQPPRRVWRRLRSERARGHLRKTRHRTQKSPRWRHERRMHLCAHLGRPRRQHSVPPNSPSGVSHLQRAAAADSTRQLRASQCEKLRQDAPSGSAHAPPKKGLSGHAYRDQWEGRVDLKRDRDEHTTRVFALSAVMESQRARLRSGREQGVNSAFNFPSTCWPSPTNAQGKPKQTSQLVVTQICPHRFVRRCSIPSPGTTLSDEYF